MADNFEYSEENLNEFPYRVLQKLAKSLGLPSNVKVSIKIINFALCLFISRLF